jgi:hypothetical protein
MVRDKLQNVAECACKCLRIRPGVLDLSYVSVLQSSAD